MSDVDGDGETTLALIGLRLPLRHHTHPYRRAPPPARHAREQDGCTPGPVTGATSTGGKPLPVDVARPRVGVDMPSALLASSSLDLQEAPPEERHPEDHGKDHSRGRP